MSTSTCSEDLFSRKTTAILSVYKPSKGTIYNSYEVNEEGKYYADFIAPETGYYRIELDNYSGQQFKYSVGIYDLDLRISIEKNNIVLIIKTAYLII